ncbi:oligosaccharide flippase family protein [Acidisphaera sp. L21]|uniref:oligosaccharide flippase family protein n=1 Tax=Acidisphaera sp. L21 TaxID=1641851 RepID=UPI00131A7033|nr:oligosaccharide flippase family protein [Acidisphaera sp. L21]
MKRMLGAFGLGVVARGASQVTALVVSIIAARVLGQEQFGIYAIASVFVVIAQAVQWGGVYDYVVKDRGTDADLDTPFWINLAIGVIGSVLIFILAPLLGYGTGLPEVLYLMLALAPSTTLAGFVSWSEAVLLQRARLGPYYVLSIVSEVMACTVALLCFRGGLGVWSFVIYRYVQLTMAATLNTALTRRLPRMRFDRAMAHVVLRFANRINASRLVAMGGMYAPDLLLGFFAGPAATASYRFANRIVNGVCDMFYAPVSKQAWVSLSGHGEDISARTRIWAGLLQVVALIVWPSLLGIATLSHGLIELLAGSAWLDAAPVIVLIAIARTLLVFEQFFEPLLGIRNRAGLVFRIRSVLAVMAIVAFLIFAHFGAIGGGVSQVVIGLASAAISIRICLSETSLSVAKLVQVLIPPAFGTAIAVVASLLASAAVQGYAPSIRVAAAIGVSGAVWLLCVAAAARMTTLLSPIRGMT